jgi:hypothetical protein
VSSSESVDVLLCALCDRPCTEVDGGRDWYHLELTREQPVSGVHWWSVDFCTQGHAAAWLGAPLPAPVTTGDGQAENRTWRDAVLEGVVFSAVSVLTLGLWGLGAWTAVRFLINLF